jgi:acetyl esterase/lipase
MTHVNRIAAGAIAATRGSGDGLLERVSAMVSTDIHAHDGCCAVPARLEDLTGLPPAWWGVGTLDLFHDEDIAYAERLGGADVPC